MKLRILKSRFAFILGAVLIVTFDGISRGAQPVDFNRDVRPILSSNCFKCHGIDDGGRKARLRLDVRAIAIGRAKSGKAAIVPGKPDESQLVHRVFSSDADEVMPPASTKVVLSDAQKQVLRQWIAEGAEYKVHWAFVAPRQVTPPLVNQAGWAKNPIDQFILARLESEGLKPSPEADRFALIRRLYLDLIGLPPTPQEADAFFNDRSTDAYERLVDRLLANPHYGERWARRWLDLARYADTNGFEKDRARSIWPYRDWVILALNTDMPFDQFTIKQLAGDMLPNATAEDRIATGFHRNTMLNEEGGIDPLEYRFRAAVDRTNTTGTTWLGLTVGCAQCHTHKFDPIKQSEYYSLMAFLNNADEPDLEVPSSDPAARSVEIERKIRKLSDELPDKFSVGGPVKWATPAAMVTTAGGSEPQKVEDGSWRFTGPMPARDTYTFTFNSALANVDRVRVEVLLDGNIGPGRIPHGNFVLSEIAATVTPVDSPDAAQSVKFVRAESDFSQKGFPVEAAINKKLGPGWAVAGPGLVSDHTATFYLDKPVQLDRPARWTIKLDQQRGQNHTMARVRVSLGAPYNQEISTADRRAALDRAYTAWQESETAKAVKWTVLRPAKMHATMPFLTLQDDGSIFAGGDIIKSDTYELNFADVPRGIAAVRLEVLPDDRLPNHGPGLVYYEGAAGDFFLSEISLTADGKASKFAKAVQSYGDGKFVAANAIDGDPQTGWSVKGEQGKPNQAIFSLSEPLGDVKELSLRLLFERYFAASLGHFRIAVSTDPKAVDSSPLQPDVNDVLLLATNARTQAQRDRLFQYYLSIAPELAEARKQIDQLRESLPKPVTTLILSERPAGHDRPTFVHHRGEFLQPTDQVHPGVPSFLPPLPAGMPADRLTFARWLVSPENPLTARVTVNRQWQAFFGRGMVRTLQDFGYQGELPTHPELLDWLAVEFMRQGWSMKKLDRLIVTSATYRQSSVVTPALLAGDPQNILLSRGPRFRLEAEIIRDSALDAAGILSQKMGGPSVFPPQPASVTTEGAYGALVWTPSAGEDRFRRSLYTYSKRTAPFAMYNAFDGPTGEECVARREVSNTPLQALSLLNDTVFLDAAQALGRAVAATNESDDAKTTEILRRYLTRPPDQEEVTALTEFARRQRERFTNKELDPAKLAGSSDGNVIEAATWTAVARAVMNLDEVVTKQ